MHGMRTKNPTNSVSECSFACALLLRAEDERRLRAFGRILKAPRYPTSDVLISLVLAVCQRVSDHCVHQMPITRRWQDRKSGPAIVISRLYFCRVSLEYKAVVCHTIWRR